MRTSSAVLLRDTKSPLRDRQRDLTRRLIVDALARVILREGIHQFSMPQVAGEAGVSLRTLYRYFPSRDELLSGLASEVEETLHRAALPATVDTIHLLSGDELAAVVGALVRALGSRPTLAHAWVIANMATGFPGEVRKSHHEAMRRVVEHVGPHLDSKERKRVFGVVRYLTGSLAWMVMTQDLGLETDEAAEASTWALRTLLKEIESGGRPGGGN